MAKDPHAQADKLYHDMLDLLEELAAVYADAESAEEEGDGDGFDVQDVIDAVVEEAAERGLDEESAVRAFKAIATLAQKAAEV